MANREVNNAPPFKPVSKAEYQAMTEKKRSLNLFLVVAILSGLGIAVSFVVFLWNKVGPIDFDGTVNNDLLGTLGDFIGGILGTLIALYSIYMLVKTLHAQIDSNVNARETNDIVVETNKAQIELSSQQLFDNKFQVFFNQYKDTISAYVDKDLKGRQALEFIVAAFLSAPFNNKLMYKKRVVASVREFEAFYAGHREQLAVHFRELYQLVRLVAESEMEEDDRVLYAKCIRGQLSDGELAILRYNCLTDNGFAMRRFVNHFNLLKHLPLMTLLEFKTWSGMLPDKHMRSALDSTFIMLRKMMKEYNYTNEALDIPDIELSSRYVVKISYNEDHSSMIFRLEEDKQHRGAAGVKRPYVEKALDTLGTREIPELFYSFLHESFITSNFDLYGNPSNCVHTPIIVVNNASKFIFEIEVKGPRKLVLAENQMYPAKQ